MRWPVVLKPELMESLSSWLERHAKYYKISMKTLFISGLNIPPINNLIEVDFYKIKNLFLNIENKTGIKEETLHQMTLESFSPKVFDFMDIHTSKDLENYVNTFIVFCWINKINLIKNSSKNININVMPWVRETPWSSRYLFERFCPKCVNEFIGYKLLVWRLCILSTCPKHKCFLVEKRNYVGRNYVNRTIQIFGKNYFDTDIESIELKNELILLDEMTLNAFKYGYVSFCNGDKMSDIVWFRFLRGLAKQLCLIKNKYTKYSYLKNDLLKNLPIVASHKHLFETLEQKERISIMTCIGAILSNWPEGIISRLHLDLPSKIPHVFKNLVPFTLANYLEISMNNDEIYRFNSHFFILSSILKNKGLEQEMVQELKTSSDARDSMFKILTYNNAMSSEEAWKYIHEICYFSFVHKKINR